MKVKVLEDIEWQGTKYRKGDTIYMLWGDAVKYARRGLVELPAGQKPVGPTNHKPDGPEELK